jgi:cysteine synthase A
VRDLCGKSGYIWLNQYSNPANAQAHYRTTGPEIAKMFPDVDVVFIGAGTTGTLMGSALYLREVRPEVTIVAIDAAGSVTFGGPAGRRMIPGLGTGVRPGLLDESRVDAVVLVPETDTIRACRRLARHGFLFGGSTGTVVSGAVSWLDENHPTGQLTTVAIAPDFGERYLDTVYNDEWLLDAYGAGVLDLYSGHGAA